ncbi:hypothetical protein [Mycobacterium decipiens]|uniref:hypothetical protein n=1 Tax=Mycobacterium decipiens TaxID=1430326 RepID=UPI000E5D2211|nr:hypothetical protein [Mycobacterium decipiens]
MPIRIGTPALGASGRVQRRLGMKSELGPALVHMLNRRYVVSNGKARDVLGFNPTVAYQEGWRDPSGAPAARASSQAGPQQIRSGLKRACRPTR